MLCICTTLQTVFSSVAKMSIVPACLTMHFLRTSPWHVFNLPVLENTAWAWLVHDRYLIVHNCWSLKERKQEYMSYPLVQHELNLLWILLMPGIRFFNRLKIRWRFPKTIYWVHFPGHKGQGESQAFQIFSADVLPEVQILIQNSSKLLGSAKLVWKSPEDDFSALQNQEVKDHAKINNNFKKVKDFSF